MVEEVTKNVYDEILDEEDYGHGAVGSEVGYPFLQNVPMKNSPAFGVFFLKEERAQGLRPEGMGLVQVPFRSGVEVGYAWESIEVLILARRRDWGVSYTDPATGRQRKVPIGTYDQAAEEAKKIEGATRKSRERALVLVRGMSQAPVMLTAWGASAKSIANALDTFTGSILRVAESDLRYTRIAAGKSGEVSLPMYSIYCPLRFGPEIKAHPMWSTYITPVVLDIPQTVLVSDAQCLAYARANFASKEEIAHARSLWDAACQWRDAPLLGHEPNAQVVTAQPAQNPIQTFASAFAPAPAQAPAQYQPQPAPAQAPAPATERPAAPPWAPKSYV